MYIKHYRVPYGERCRLLDRKGFIGTVLNELHQGVRGATLTFVIEDGQFSKTTKSQSGGKYVITLPKLGRYSVKITHPNYKTTLSGKESVPNECGHRHRNFTLRSDVPPPTGVRGRVTDMRNNQPVRGADICAMEQQTLRRYCIKANNSGYYSISAPVGNYTVNASHPSYNKAASKNVNITRGYAQAHFKLNLKISTSPGGSGSLPPKRTEKEIY